MHFRGRFDPEATDSALESCSECPRPDRKEHGGIPFYAWGEDYKPDLTRSLNPPAFDQLGRGGRIAVQDCYVFRALGTGDMELLTDAHRDDTTSLADVEEFLLLASGMSELGDYTAPWDVASDRRYNQIVAQLLRRVPDANMACAPRRTKP